ncbi:MAG TPA: hypothetical protein VE757_07875, partial [Gaiellaceae bacterium]|nr:hypothetical protein [Gaiellaceae bacterium]
RRRRTLPALAPPGPERFAPAAAAALVSGAAAAALPFYPSGWPLGLAALAAALTLFRERAGLAFALAVPILPLGNVSSGLAWAYAALALGWLVMSWKAPRNGLFFAAGPVLAPLSLLGLLPFAAQRLRGGIVRGLQVLAAVLVAALAAGLRGGTIPFVGETAPPLDLNGTQDPLAAAGAVWHALAAQPVLLFEAVVLAAAATVLPHVRRRWIAPFCVALLAGIVAVDPALPDIAVVATILATCLGMAGKRES